MRALLDTCVISKIRHPQGTESVKTAVRKLNENTIHLSVITIGEIVKGIQILAEGLRKQELQNWIQGLEQW